MKYHFKLSARKSPGKSPDRSNNSLNQSKKSKNIYKPNPYLISFQISETTEKTKNISENSNNSSILSKPEKSIHSLKSRDLLKNFLKPIKNDKININSYFEAKKTDFLKLWNDLPKPTNYLKIEERFLNFLSNIEIIEIKNFKEIFYINLTKKENKEKIHSSKKNELAPIIKKCVLKKDEEGLDPVTHDQIFYRYEILNLLGEGTFGKVYKAFDHKKKILVALKIVKKNLNFILQGQNEIKILKFIRDYEGTSNLLEIKNSTMFRNQLIIITECLSISLYSYLKFNDFIGFDQSLIRKFAIQILQGLTFLYKFNLIHCDLKPDNILLKTPDKTGLKIIDFGSSCFYSSRIYNYIQSRYYRSPEILLGHVYSPAIDMWSFGCIIAELYKGTPLFPGQNELEQLSRIIEVLGTPNQYHLSNCIRRKRFFDDDFEPIFLNDIRCGGYRKPHSVSLSSLINSNDEDFINFIQKCLVFEPHLRMKPLEALTHQWILKELPKDIKIAFLEEIKRLEICLLKRDEAIYIEENNKNNSKKKATLNSFHIKKNVIDFKEKKSNTFHKKS